MGAAARPSRRYRAGVFAGPSYLYGDPAGPIHVNPPARFTPLSMPTPNLDFWDAAAARHVDSDFYDTAGFLAGRDTLTAVEAPLVGDDLAGQRALHLQCHFGQDSLSLARRGAEVTGVDFSGAAIAAARRLAAQAGLEARFVEADVLRADAALSGEGGTYDLVFASWGTVGWLPSIARWAEVVAHFLRAGGRLVFAEFHPALWMFDDDHERVTYPYGWGRSVRMRVGESYAAGDLGATYELSEYAYGLGDVVGALLAAGLRLTHLREYDFSPYPLFGEAGVEAAPGRWQIRGQEGLVPLAYSLVAERGGE